MDAGFKQEITRRSFAKVGGMALASLMLGVVPWQLSGCAAPGGASDAPSGDSPSDASSAFAIGDLSPELVEQAAGILSTVAFRTPLVQAPTVKGDIDLRLKLENLQKTGSFKLRGASAMMAMLSDEERARGVATCSAGNHAQGVAYSSQVYGIPATIFIPASAPQAKIEATRSYGVDVRLVDGEFDDAKAEAEAFVASSGCAYVPPYDDYRVMAGQGTVGLEVLEDFADVEAVVVPVGGGGLIAGMACALKAAKPDVKVYGVQSEMVPSMKASLEAGKIVTVEAKTTLADGIHVATPGTKTFEVVQKLVDGVFTVTEEQIAAAIDHLAEHEKVVAEGAGAVSVAAVLNNVVPLGDAKNVVCLVSGGNVDAARLSQLLAG